MTKKASVNESVKVEDVKTEADKIWEEIKDKYIDMFSLPNQKVFQYCQPISIDPSKLYVKLQATSVLPSLEAAVGKDFEVSLLDKYVVVSRIK